MNTARASTSRPLALPRILALAVIAHGACSFAPAAAPQTSGTSAAAESSKLDMDALYNIGRQLFEDFAPERIKEQYEFMSIDEWRSFIGEFEDTIANGSLEEIAALQPKAALTLQAMRMKPEVSEYADWLSERIELIEGAKEALAQNAARPAPLPPLPQVGLKPAPPPAVFLPSGTAQPPDAIARHFSLPLIKPLPQPFYQTPPPSDSIPYYNLWFKRVAHRAIPRNAATLSPLLKIIFTSENLPAELIWIAEIESSFNPRALSPAGACGLYQLMPATARAFGLSLTPVDERTHAGKNARAAAQLLGRLHKRFGSWPLALAAYNAGEGRVAVALKKTPGAKTFADIVQKLPAETRLYVPQVLATVVVREKVALEKFVPAAEIPLPSVVYLPRKPAS